MTAAGKIIPATPRTILQIHHNETNQLNPQNANAIVMTSGFLWTYHLCLLRYVRNDINLALFQKPQQKSSFAAGYFSICFLV
jgi:hypothetical protein